MKKYLILLPFFIWGCASSKKKEVSTSSASAVQWESKAQVRDFKQNKTNNLSIDIIAVKNSKMRMEVSATMGYPVASFVSTPSDVKLAVYTQKKFYYGPNSNLALKRAINWPLEPHVLHNIVFDLPIKGWVCENGQSGLVSLCKKKTTSGDIIISWPDRKEGSKRVIVQAPQFEMQWQFKSYSVVQQPREETFQLEAPSGYKLINL